MRIRRRLVLAGDPDELLPLHLITRTVKRYMFVDVRIPLAEEGLIVLADRLPQVFHRIFELLVDLLVVFQGRGLWGLRLSYRPHAVLLSEVAPAPGCEVSQHLFGDPL